MDQTLVHHTAKSHLPGSAKWFMAMHDAEARALGSAVLPQNTRLISGPVSAREGFKVAKYEPLMSLLKLLVVIGMGCSRRWYATRYWASWWVPLDLGS